MDSSTIQNDAKTILNSLDLKDPNYKKFILKRGSKRQQVSVLCNKLNESFPETEDEIKFNLQKLNELKPALTDLDETILEVLLDKDLLNEDQLDKISLACEMYLDNLNLNVVKLELALKNLEVQRNSDGEISRAEPSYKGKLRVPDIELPEFDGQPEEYESFISSLDEILNKFKLTQYEKYTYLRKQVLGNAREVVSSVPKTGNCYDSAKTLLAKTFSNKVVQQFSVIKKLVNLKLNFENRFSWLSESSTLVEQVKRLDINTESFIQYFLWKGMDEQFKKEYTSLTKSCRPSYTELMENMHEVFGLVEAAHEAQPKTSTITLATGVKQNPKNSFKSICLLCKSDGNKNCFAHKMADCPVYKSVNEKISKIKDQNGCIKCSLLNHDSKTCRWVFRDKCSICHKDHVSFLCLSNTKNPGAKESVKPKTFPKQKFQNSRTSNSPKSEGGAGKVDAQVISYSVLNNTTNTDVLLPTFSAKLEGSKRFSRVLYDSASQLTFITEKALKGTNYAIVTDEFSIQINGFNESRILTTKLVTTSILVNGDFRKITAVVVPQIKTKIDTSKLKPILKAFKDAKIEIADKFLGDNGGTVDILLGADNLHVIPVQSCFLGKPGEESLYFYCSQGVMLIGSTSKLLVNIPNLPSVKDFICKIRSTF